MLLRNELIKNDQIKICHLDEYDDSILNNSLDLTNYFKNTFQSLIDPSILVIKYSLEHRILYIIREILGNNFHFSSASLQLEIYPEYAAKHFNFEGIGCKEEFQDFVSRNYDRLDDCCYTLEDKKLETNHFQLNTNIEKSLLLLHPAFLLLLQLFASNTKAYQWYSNQYSYLCLKIDWQEKAHSFFTLLEDLKAIAHTHEPILREKLTDNIILKLKKSPSNLNESDLNLKSEWQKIGYLAEEVSFDLALNEVNQIALHAFKKLEYNQRITIHYSLLDPSYLELDIDTALKDVSEFTSELIDEYIFEIANNITSVAKMEWFESQ